MDSVTPLTMISNGQTEVRENLAGHLVRLWRYAYVLSGRRDVAEDLVQATCVRALEKSHQYLPGSKLDRWLFAILHSIWLNDIRAARVRRAEALADHEAESAHDGARAAETAVHARQVLSRVAELPEGQRATVFLVCVEGFAYREAAEALGVPIGTVMSRLAAARAALAGLAGDTPQRNSSKATTR